MPNSIDFYKGIFLHVIPVRIIVPCFNNTDNVSTLLKIVLVIIKNGNKSVKSNALLDSGSDVTLTNKDLASKLNLSEIAKCLIYIMLYQKYKRLNVNQSLLLIHSMFNQIVSKFHHLKMIISI